MNSHKKSLITVIGMLSLPLFAAEITEQKSVIVSKKCKATLVKINDDEKTLSDYFDKIFNTVAFLPDNINANDDYKPSDIFNLIARKQLFRQLRISSYRYLEHMTLDEYIHKIIPSADQLDTVFAQQLQERKNITQTWQWFNMYFNQEVLKKPLEAYKNRLIEEDTQRAQKQ